jgi:hypothetical protein
VSFVTVIQAATITQAPDVPTVIEAGSGFVLVVSPAVVGVASEKVVESTPLKTKAIIDESTVLLLLAFPATVVSVVAPCFLYQMAREGLSEPAPVCDVKSV